MWSGFKSTCEPHNHMWQYSKFSRVITCFKITRWKLWTISHANILVFTCGIYGIHMWSHITKSPSEILWTISHVNVLIFTCGMLWHSRVITCSKITKWKIVKNFSWISHVALRVETTCDFLLCDFMFTCEKEHISHVKSRVKHSTCFVYIITCDLTQLWPTTPSHTWT